MHKILPMTLYPVFSPCIVLFVAMVMVPGATDRYWQVSHSSLTEGNEIQSQSYFFIDICLQ